MAFIGALRPSQLACAHHGKSLRRTHAPARLPLLRATNKTSVQASATREDIKKQLQLAVKNEAYAEAAALKRQLDELDSSDPVVQLRAALQQAIAEQRFKDAARLQAELQSVEPEAAAASSSSSDASSPASTSSNVLTKGVRVIVKSFFVPSRSAPVVPGQWFFAYHVTIVNEGQDIVQLRTRHWKILNANGHKDEVRGPGVVGVQPILLPGKRYEYMSACPLSTASGSMEGSFAMAVLRESDGQFGETFDARIGRFALSTSGETAE